MNIHAFGGSWTETKLIILEEYLRSYATALKNQKFRLHYVDAFAGTGTIAPKQRNASNNLSLFPNEFGAIDVIKGSALRAISQPGFYAYHFNDLNQAHVEELECIRADNPDKNINITRGDANTFLCSFVANMRSLDRAVVFIDPYATELAWSTLEKLAGSHKVDIWLLFPFGSVTRLLPNDLQSLPENWEAKITGLLGTKGWKEHLYRKDEPPPMLDLFDDAGAANSRHSRVNARALANYIATRLSDIFPYASDPIPLVNSKSSTLYQFYFLVSNPRATTVAAKIAKGVIKQAQRLRS